MSETSFNGTEGRVFYSKWEPDGPPRRIVMLVHGYAEHGARYGHVAEALTAHGAVVYAEDHIGHGRSEGERALITNFNHVVDDMHTLAEMARGDYPGIPLVLVGHSMGGLLSGRFAQRWPEKVAGVGFSGAVIGDWQWARDAIGAAALPEVEFDPMAISRDPAAGASYAADPLVYHGQYKRGLLEAEVEALDLFREANDRLTMPVLLMHGTEDPFVPFERSLQAVHDMPTEDVTVHLFEGARHELLNEINRDEITQRLVEWIDRVA